MTNFNGYIRWTAFFVSGKTEDDSLYPSIYMIDISSGALIQRIFLDTVMNVTVNGVAETDYGRGGVPSGQPAAIDSDGNGYVDRIYIGTDKGFMYKVNIPDEDPDPSEELDDISVCVINGDFQVGTGGDTIPADQQWHPIYAAPTVLVDNEMVGDAINYQVLLFWGTSDNPYYDEGTDVSTTTYHFFAYLDQDSKAECSAAELEWFYELPPGHRVYASAFAAAGQIYFGTSTSTVEDPCAASVGDDSNQGRLYVLDMDTGVSLLSDPDDGGEGLKVGDVRTSPLVDDQHLYFKTSAGLLSLGAGQYNNAINLGSLSNPQVRLWREIWEE